MRSLLLPLAAFALMPAVSEAARLSMTDEVAHPLPAALFGQFLERPSWGGEFGPEGVVDEQGRLSARVESALADLHAPVVRFPSGTDNDYLEWTDMIDLPDRSERPVSIGHKGGEVTNRFGLDEYFHLARRMGWRTIVVTNLRDALHKKVPLEEAAAHAAALAAYAGAETGSPEWVSLRAANGRQEPGEIAAVQVGNEGWYFWPPTAEERLALGLSDDEACARWLRECLIAYADAILAVLPGVPLIADAPRLPDAGGIINDAGKVWRSALDHPDIRARYKYLAAHAYGPMEMKEVSRGSGVLAPEEVTEDALWYALASTPGRYDDQGRAVADAAAYEAIAALGFRTAVTEWNWNGWGLEKRFPQASFRDGLPAMLGAAGFLHGLMRSPHVALATQSMMLGTQWNIASVRAAADGAVAYSPQAEAVRLHAEYHGGEVMVSRLEDVKAYPNPPRFVWWWPEIERLALMEALVSADDAHWYVHVLNRHRSEAEPLHILLPASASMEGSARVVLLRGDPRRASTSAPGAIERTSAEVEWSGRALDVALPTASVGVIVIPKSTGPNP